MIKFLDNKLFRYLFVFLFFNSSILPVRSSSALAAWVINTNGVLELRFIAHAARALEDLTGRIEEFKNKKTDK